MSLSESLISIQNDTQDIPEPSRQSDGSRSICQGGEEVCIFRVLHSMMSCKPDAYVPSIVSLGPYHHGSKCEMDRHKREAVRRMTRRIKKDEALQETVTRINKDEAFLIGELEKKIIEHHEEETNWHGEKFLEKKIRQHYEEEITYGGEKLCWMMINDACFILEFFKCAAESGHQNGQGSFNPVFQKKGFKNSLYNTILTDIMKLENQVPLFILINLLHLEFETSNNAIKELAKMLSKHNLFKGFPFSSSDEDVDSEQKKIDVNTEQKLIKYIEEGACHLLDLYRMVIEDQLSPRPDELPCIPGYEQLPCSPKETEPLIDKRPTPCAEKLDSAGIEFESGESKFEKRMFGMSKLFLPQITVKYKTETLLRNVVAYEECKRCSAKPKRAVISNYVCLLDKLIDSEKDAAVLRESKVIKSFVGSDEVVVRMFNELAIGITIDTPDGDIAITTETSEQIPEFEKAMKDARDHYNNRWNRLLSEFHQTYCSKPWYIVSLLAATALLVMTLIQTVYAVK